MDGKLRGAVKQNNSTNSSRHPGDSDLTINCNSPTKEEIKRAIKQIKNNKASGPDDIPAEVLKADGVSVHLLIKGVGIWDLFDFMSFQVAYHMNCSKTYRQQFINDFSTNKYY
jgi:N-acetyl-anhydromuramyl-L-alanine amidase AmpD